MKNADLNECIKTFQVYASTADSLTMQDVFDLAQQAETQPFNSPGE
jgi:hypothetical protein